MQNVIVSLGSIKSRSEHQVWLGGNLPRDPHSQQWCTDRDWDWNYDWDRDGDRDRHWSRVFL